MSQERENPMQDAFHREFAEHNRSLFEVYEETQGEIYRAIFKGKANIIHIQDEGVFLSDMSDGDREENEEAMIGSLSGDWENVEAANLAFRRERARRLFDVTNLFPPEWEWSGQQIEYEITVRARRINPNSPNT